MKKCLIVNIILFTITLPVVAQNFGVSSGLTYYKDAQVFRLKAWTTMKKKEWSHVIYLFPQFQQGAITFNTGFIAEKKLLMNFNIYLNETEFITEMGDTLVLKDSPQIKLVSIGDRFFYNDFPGGYIEKIGRNKIALGAKHSLKMMMESSAGEIFATTDFKVPTSRFDRLFIKKDLYFFMDNDGQTFKASLNSIFKLLPEFKTEIKTFIHKNKINFRVKEDLLKLLYFCDRLETSI